MVSDTNLIILHGRLARAPELSCTPNQTTIGKFSLASNHKWTGKDGQEREEVLFIECTAFGYMANRAAKYGAKGADVLIEGRLKLDTWTGQDGTKHSRHSIVVEHLFLDKPDPESQPAATGSSGKPTEPGTRTPPPGPLAGEDIPF
jgi:single-strand DNA-binding protein